MRTSAMHAGSSSGGGGGGGAEGEEDDAPRGAGFANLIFPHAQRTAESAYRVPTPPRIVIPPPTLSPGLNSITGGGGDGDGGGGVGVGDTRSFARSRLYPGSSSLGGGDSDHIGCSAAFSDNHDSELGTFRGVMRNGDDSNTSSAYNGLNSRNNGYTSNTNNNSSTSKNATHSQSQNQSRNHSNNNDNDNLLIPLPQTSFLSTHNYRDLIQRNGMLEWTYERRREAQMVLPCIYLGPMSAARDEAFLQREGITCLLGIRQKGGSVGGGLAFGGPGIGSSNGSNRGVSGASNGGVALPTNTAGGGAATPPESKLMNGAMRTAARLGIEHHTIDLATHQDLIRAFPSTTALIVKHLSSLAHKAGNSSHQGEEPNPMTSSRSQSRRSDQVEDDGKASRKVLVFCESGNERSAGVVAALLMEAYANVDYVRAIQICQAQRFCVSFDDNMKGLLQCYWDILCARREVGGGDCVGTGSECPNGFAQPHDEIVEMSGMGSASRGADASRAAPRKAKRALDRGDEDGDQEMEDVDADDVERFEGRRHWTPFVDYDGLDLTMQ